MTSHLRSHGAILNVSQSEYAGGFFQRPASLVSQPSALEPGKATQLEGFLRSFSDVLFGGSSPSSSVPSWPMLDEARRLRWSGNLAATGFCPLTARICARTLCKVAGTMAR